MKKIFSAALALVCVWFATPALAANCNLFDEVLEVGDMSNGTPVAGSNRMRSVNYISIEPATTYYLGATSNWHLWLYDNDKNFIQEWSSIQNQNFTTPANAHYFKVSTYPNYGTTYLNDLIVTKGTTATAYTPYNPLCATCDGTIVNYVSATGTVSQSGTPTPDNPIYPTFYTQGDMVLRKVGNYADSYDATTGKITRRVGVKVLDGTENWSIDGNTTWFYNSSIKAGAQTGISSHGKVNKSASGEFGFSGAGFVEINTEKIGIETTNNAIQQYLAQQYANGTPVTIYYPLAEETTEDWPASYCETPIKIATTKYNESAFSPLNTALQNAISVVDSVVSNTITQAASIATLQVQKQTRPNDIADDNEKCPAGKKCLLVEDASGIPHWYEIVTGRLPDGYTELEYIESTGTQYIKLPSFPNASNINVTADVLQTNGTNEQIFFAIDSVQTLYTSGGSWRTWKSGASGVSLTNTSSRHLFDIKTTRSGVKYYIDGTQNTNVSATFYTSELFSARILFLGARTTNSGADYFWQGRIYSFNSECDGVVCMNLVPALNPDGKIGMYDLVGGRFYENAGTGEFIGGQPVFN